MKWLKGGVRFVVVSVGIIALTSLGIDASQYLTGSQSALGILADRTLEESCPVGMVKAETAGHSFCIDVYEVSTSAECPFQTPATELETQQNINTAGCTAESIAEEYPWTAMTYVQARTLCAKDGKRLPTNEEWFTAALGTYDTAGCNSDGNLAQTGEFAGCISGYGTFDMVGNAWEWVEADVVNAQYNERSLPETGFVSTVDGAGIALTTTSTAQSVYNGDYFWSIASGTSAMMRGGFHGSGEDAGVFSVHAGVEPAFAGPVTGVRCAVSL